MHIGETWVSGICCLALRLALSGAWFTSFPHGFLMISSPPLQHNCRQQFRRAGLLIWPRSKRLLNAVHADLPQQTLRLSSMLVRARC